MKRQVSIEEISDGRLYRSQDMVRADCRGCEGCSACCRGMGVSVILDPLDVWRIAEGTGMPAHELLEKGFLELNVADGVILPNLSMKGEKEACRFLNEDGRCRIHTARPGICRLFPLGRYYHDGRFDYFLQIHECSKRDRSKIKVSKWIDTPDLEQYESFVLKWHDFLEAVQTYLTSVTDDELLKRINIYILRSFYLRTWESGEDFYRQVNSQISKSREMLGI